jgi:DNA-binding NarL/FixJ family response regulator
MTSRTVCAVKDVIPTYRQGIARELAGVGYETAEPVDCDAWIRKFRHATHTSDCRLAVLTSIREQADLDIVKELRAAHDEVVLLALLVDPTVDHFSRALEFGAWGAVDYAASPAEIVETLDATWAGAVRLPRAVAVELTRGGRRRHHSPVGDADVRRLAALAEGWSVERLARHENFSTREMFRRLNDLYRNLGVRNRHQAVVVAARSGLLDSTIEDVGR